jgi:hypothetical protein
MPLREELKNENAQRFVNKKVDLHAKHTTPPNTARPAATSTATCPQSPIEQVSMSLPRIWQWPNLLAIDAALIALAWQETLASRAEFDLSPAARLVLALSVWLSYMADRLFDVANRPATQLRSIRHRFAKKHARKLWAIWVVTLTTNLIIAFGHLETIQLRNGSVLLALCLLYTALNQSYSRNFFPKEICVAIIFAGGAIVFLPPPFPWLATGTLALLCLTNCLMIGSKERAIDAAMQVRSMAQWPSKLILLSWLATGLPLFLLDAQLTLALSLSLGALLIIQTRQAPLKVESFRILTDTALLIGPAGAWIWQI